MSEIKAFIDPAGEPTSELTAHDVSEISQELITDLTREEVERFTELQPVSLALAKRAIETLPQGVGTSVSATRPFPIFIERGEGARVWDQDGRSYSDYFNGFGVSVFGHANPEITRAIIERAESGVHFGAASEEAVEWAELLVERYRLNWVRMSQSGTEATMDAIRLARARTERELIVKIEGGYHGAHPEALVSTNLPLDESAGPDQSPAARPFGGGLLRSTVESVRPIPFNSIDAAERALEAGDVAAVLIEPILFNVGAIFPERGYLEALRELCSKHGTILIFDETKTAVTVARGGAEELFGVRPDLKTMGKGIGGGLGCGAIGGAEEWGYEEISSWRVPHLSTFAANPLTAAAGAAALGGVLTPEAYERLEQHRRALASALGEAIRRWELPAYVISTGGKGCVVWVDPSGGELRDFRDYKRRFNFQLGTLAWLWLVNRGVLLAPGQDEQWTHSIAHTERELNEFAGALDSLGERLRS